MRVLGIDPGTAITGYGVLDLSKDGSITVVEYGCLITAAGEDMSVRLLTLSKQLKLLLVKFKPQELSLERIFFNTNVKTALSVGQARGVVMLAAAENKVPIFEYTALQAKLVLTGYGRAKKKEMQLAVPEYLGISGKIKQDDAADGLAMAITHIVKCHSDLCKKEEVKRKI